MNKLLFLFPLLFFIPTSGSDKICNLWQSIDPNVARFSADADPTINAYCNGGFVIGCELIS